MNYLHQNMDQREKMRVLGEIRLLNKYVQRAKKIAIRAINPVALADGAELESKPTFNIEVEGPPNHISYFKKLLIDANLKIG
jgi:hypothetical protein